MLQRTFESTVLKKLLQWAAASLELSLNQPALPHAIIVLNATDLSVDENQWEVEYTTSKLMSDIAGASERVEDFRRYADIWESRGRRITTIKELLECYYSSVTVVRIPTKGRYGLLHQQVRKLHRQIALKCQTALLIKQRVRMLPNSDDLQTYLQSAFDHFSKSLNDPFNFVQVALRNNPIPLDFGGNILKLAISILEHPLELNGPDLFKALSPIVASCIMLDMARHRLLGKRLTCRFFLISRL